MTRSHETHLTPVKMTFGRHLQHIGLGIWQSLEGNNPKTIEMGGRTFFRFLDRLYIPTETDNLDDEQIRLINRFREDSIEFDHQFLYHDAIRDLFRRSFTSLGIANAIEVGPGKFPLLCDSFREYLAIELDEEAIAVLKGQNIAAISPLQLATAPSKLKHYDLCFALFVFHFRIGRETLAQVIEQLGKEAIFVFNVVTHHAGIRTLLLDDLSALGYSAKAIDLRPTYGKDDMVFICHPDREARRANSAYEAFQSEIRERK